MLVFEYAAGREEAEHCTSTLPKHFSSIAHAQSICRHVPVPDPLPAADRGFVPALAKGTMTGKRNPPGFPTLKTMSVSEGWGGLGEATACQKKGQMSVTIVADAGCKGL
jgi:hypothetical protein